MIFLKIALIVVLCYIFSRGLTSDYEKQIQVEKDKVKTVQKAFIEYQELTDEQRDSLVKTINELREELQVLKELKRWHQTNLITNINILNGTEIIELNLKSHIEKKTDCYGTLNLGKICKEKQVRELQLKKSLNILC